MIAHRDGGYHRHTDWHDMTFHSFPCLLCVTETRMSRFRKLGLVSSRKELGELSISLCALLPCPSKFVRSWTRAQNESYFWLGMMVYGVLCFLRLGLLTKCWIDVLRVIALLNQVLERCSRLCWMNGKFPNLETFARDVGKLEDVFYESVLYAFPYSSCFWMMR